MHDGLLMYKVFMNIDKNTGLLTLAEYIPSPNCDERPYGKSGETEELKSGELEISAELSLIVIHNISLPPGQFGGSYITQLFTNTLNPEEHEFFREIHDLRVSSHLLINRLGEVTQYVPFHQRAWHAGVSSYLGKSVCNNFSIGIEMEGTDDTDFTETQYVCLIKVLKALVKAYPSLDMQHITGHEHIAPGRKTDPGPYFDWHRVGRECQAVLPASAKTICE
jgi:AmpD protein